MRRLVLLAGSLTLFAVPVVARAQATSPLPADSLERGRAATRWLISGAVDSLWAAVIPTERGIFTSRESLAQAILTFASQAGTVTGKVEERFVWRGGHRQYWQVVNVSAMPEPVQIRWVMRPDGKLAGLGINPISMAPTVDSGGPVIKP